MDHEAHVECLQQSNMQLLYRTLLAFYPVDRLSTPFILAAWNCSCVQCERVFRSGTKGLKVRVQNVPKPNVNRCIPRTIHELNPYSNKLLKCCAVVFLLWCNSNQSITHSASLSCTMSHVIARGHHVVSKTNHKLCRRALLAHSMNRDQNSFNNGTRTVHNMVPV